MNELELRANLDRAKISAKNSETEVKALVQIWPTLDEPPTESMRVALCLVFDCSSSMFQDGKLEAAIESAKMIADMVPEAYLLSLVAFQSSIHLLVNNMQVSSGSLETVKDQISEIQSIAGGSTNMSEGIKEATKALLRKKADAKVMILLSDGAADEPTLAQKAALEATKAGIQIFSVGVGAGYVAEELQKISNPSSGVVFGVKDADKLKDVFANLVRRVEQFTASNVKLHVVFHPEIQAGLAFKAGPEQAFLGNMETNAAHTAEISVGNIEKEKMYSYLFTLTAPQRDPGPLEAATVVLSYDIPACKIFGEKRTASLQLEYVKNKRDAEAVNGKVLEVFRRVAVAQVLDRFLKATKAGDNEAAARYLQILIKRHEEVGDIVMKNHYAKMLKDLKDSGKVSEEALNTSVVASTVVSNAGEIPQVVDDSF